MFVPSAAAMCPAPIRKEKAGNLFAVVVPDGRRNEVPVRTTDWATAIGFLYVAVLVLVLSASG